MTLKPSCFKRIAIAFASFAGLASGASLYLELPITSASRCSVPALSAEPDFAAGAGGGASAAAGWSAGCAVVSGTAATERDAALAATANASTRLDRHTWKGVLG